MRLLIPLTLLMMPGVAAAQSHALVLEEARPWGWSTTDELDVQGVTYDLYDANSFPTAQLDQYTMMFVSSCQSDTLYNAWNARTAELDVWVQDGGFMAIHGCTWSCGSGSGNVFPQPPGGNVTWVTGTQASGTVLNAGDPLMAGVPLAPTGGSLAHLSLTATGGGGDIVLIEDPQNRPLYFRRVHGNGNIAVGTLTYEYGYANNQDAGIVLVNEVSWGQTVGTQCDPTGIDSDGDGVSDDCDKCPGFDDAVDADGDNVADGCDVCAAGNDFDNPDGDLYPSACDNCPVDANDDQLDGDLDGSGDVCDPCPAFDDSIDADVDGRPDLCDNCPSDPNPGQTDLDGDGAGDVCDICPADSPDDTDGDGVCDSTDRCDGFDDSLDGDGDGWPDDCDNCPFANNANQRDEDEDGAGNQCDCQAENPNISPLEIEICDGEDNDCNGAIDDVTEGAEYWVDADGDGFGDASADPEQGCEPPTGFVQNNSDCDDGNAKINVGATEEADEVDNNCDGQVDEGFKSGGAGGGCGCAAPGSAPSAPWLGVGLVLLGLRRRSY